MSSEKIFEFNDASQANQANGQQLIILATIHSKWMAIDRGQALRNQSANSIRDIIEELRNNSKQYSYKNCKNIMTSFEPLFNSIALCDANKIHTKIFNDNKLHWISIVIAAFIELCNCFWKRSGKHYMEFFRYFDADRIDKEISDSLFEPKDYFGKLIETMKLLASPERDTKIEYLDSELSSLNRFALIKQSFDSSDDILEQSKTKKIIHDYILKIRNIYSNIIDVIHLMQNDLLCFSLEIELEHKEKEITEGGIFSSLIYSEKSHFDQILRLKYYLRTGNLIEIETNKNDNNKDAIMKNLLNEIPITLEWLRSNDFDLPKSWTKLLLFELHQIPEIFHSMRMEMTYLAKMIGTYIKICCFFCNIKNIFKQNNQSFDVNDSDQIMRCIGFVMCSDTMNIFDNKIEQILGVYEKTKSRKKIFNVNRNEICRQTKAVCRTRSPLHKIMKDRFRTYLKNIIKTQICDKKVDFTIDNQELILIEDTMPPEMNEVKKRLKLIVKEALDELRMHRIIYVEYYEYFMNNRS